MSQVNCRECKVRIERSDCFRGWVCSRCKLLVITDLMVAQDPDMALLMESHNKRSRV